MASYQCAQLLDVLIKKYTTQINIYQEILKVAKTHYQLCKTSSFSTEEELIQLTELITKRQQLVSQLTEHNKIIDKVKQQLAEKLNIPEVNMSNLHNVYRTDSQLVDAVEQLRKLLGHVGKLLKETNGLDEKTQQLMNNKLRESAANKDKMAMMEQAKKIYQQKPTVEISPLYVDKKK